MRVQHKVDNHYNKTYDNYFCQNRNRRGIEYCNRSFTPVAVLDDIVIELLKKITLDKSLIHNYIFEDKILYNNLRSIPDVQKDIDKTELKINNLTTALSINTSSTAAKYLISEIENLDKQIISLKYELIEIENSSYKKTKVSKNIDEKYKMICYIVENLETLDYDEINKLIKDLFKECVWDGETLEIKL